MKKEINYEEVQSEPVKLELTRSNLLDYQQILDSKEADSVDEIQINYLLHYLTAEQRIGLVNKLHEILKTGGKAIFQVPYWNSSRAYGDLLLQWPPVSESWFPHLNAKWRTDNNPQETRYTCDFECTWGYGMHPLIINRNQEYQQHAIMFWKEAAQDLVASAVKN